MGECWGQEEARLGLPFMGWSGQELDRMINEGGLPREDLFFTNVICAQPPGNKFEHFTASKKDSPPDCVALGLVETGRYIKPEYLGELARLQEELNAVAPNLVVALGNKACWALLGKTAISQIRGTCHTSRMAGKWKVLPTYHPAYILRDWSKRTIVVADLLKAEREAKFPEIRRPHRWVTVNPTLDEIDAWIGRFVTSPSATPRWLAVDIETANRQITTIGFAPNRERAISIPFVDRAKPGWNYWETADLELAAWDRVERLLQCPVPKVFQNGVYDMQYLWSMGLSVVNPQHDTMLLHHSLLPEMPKGLGFLGSIYTDEPAWKLMRHDETEKKDE